MTKETKLPTRFEGLYKTFGDTTPSALFRTEKDLEEFTRLAVTIKSAGQSKIVFLYGPTGIGKSTFLYSLPIFQPEYFDKQIRLPAAYALPSNKIPDYIYSNVPQTDKITIVTIDGREEPQPDDLRSVMTNLNALLREREDLLIVWPIVDGEFMAETIKTLQKVGGESAFGASPSITFHGLDKTEYQPALEQLLRMNSSSLDDYAISTTEVRDIREKCSTIGDFLDGVSKLMNIRTSIEQIGVVLPTLVFVVSSNGEIQRICRELRRADTYFTEAARLQMYTTDSKVAVWWRERETDLLTSLPYISNLFHTQLVSLTPSAMVYSSLLFGEDDLKKLAAGPQRNLGNGKTSLQNSEFYKFFNDMKDTVKRGADTSDTVSKAYTKIQRVSETRHRFINESVMRLADYSELKFDEIYYEVPKANIQTDVLTRRGGTTYALEFHHISEGSCNPNHISKYILEKLQEYSIAYGLGKR